MSCLERLWYVGASEEMWAGFESESAHTGLLVLGQKTNATRLWILPRWAEWMENEVDFRRKAVVVTTR